MKRFDFFLCLIFGLSLFTAKAQSIQGQINDHQNQPIADALIYQHGTNNHCHSNELGLFKLDQLKIGDSIYIQHLGYQEIIYELLAEDFEKEISIQLKPQSFNLAKVTIDDNQRSTQQIAQIDLASRPVQSAQEILRYVPGLFIAQHAGGGKAEQIFLRGFDIDHGTDINIQVDGMPVNMVSHAHGQGYADLHFLIPETVQSMDFGKGPYYAQQGNFNTAGYVEFKTKDRLDKSLISTEIGQFQHNRWLAMFNLLPQVDGHDAYIAAEYLSSNGPFQSPQNLHRLNLLGKYSVWLPNNDKISLSFSHFDSRWDASGQIPERAVRSGLIDRFGAIDDTEGGQTSRSNFNLFYTKAISPNRFIKNQIYYSNYDFELYSNFTFFLEDPINGDQIRQRENRQIFGFASTYHQESNLGAVDLSLQSGLGLRFDQVKDNELSQTLNRRTTLSQLSLGQVRESNLYGFINSQFDFGQFSLIPGLRLDYFQFNYLDDLRDEYQPTSKDQAILSPKLQLVYSPQSNWQLFLKSGLGFHSNDSRVLIDPNAPNILASAFGADLGAIWRINTNLWLNTSFWLLNSEQELVYVGDAGIVEANGAGLRRGIDLGFRWQLAKELLIDQDFTYSHARFRDLPETENRIPLAPNFTATGGISFRQQMGWNAGLRYRYLRDRPANEDNSIIAQGFFIVDANLSYQWSSLNLGLTAENLLNQDWNEAQFATTSRLQNEAAEVDELHFTPGTPFFLRAKLSFSF